MGNAQQITSGSSCINVNTIGSGNTINIGAAKLPLLPIATLTPPIAERSAALLAPQAFLVQKLIGRDDILAKLKSWLFESEHKVSFCVLTGEGGAGKTRLAMHLCRKAFGQCDAKGKPRWDVGLLKGHAVRAAGENLLCGPAALQKPTLAVIDYAAPFAGGINKLLEALLSHEAALQHPLRLVLLERYADRETGWLQSVLGRGNSTAHTLPERMLDAGPIRLQPLQEAGERRRMVEETLRALESKRLAEVCDAGEAVDQRLREAPWGGQPLYLMMFAFAVDQHGLSYALRLGKKDLLRAQAKRELNRVALFSEDKATQTILEQMTAVATLCNGIARQDLVDAVGGELQHLQLTVNGGPGAVADLLELALPRLTTTPENRPEITGMAPILPDPVGSMALLLRLSLCRNPEPTLLAAHDKTPLAVLQTLLRCVLDVYDRDDTKTHVVLKWLEYAAEAETNLEMLIALGNSLPEQHTALAKFSMSITKSMMEILRAQPEPDLPRLATNLNNLSVRFSNLGRKSEALEPAQEAMGIYRTLAEQMPEAFLPDLAMSLNNLATMLAELGRKSEALEPAQEAVDSYRTLAAQMPEAYLPDLAGSLNNLAIRLSDLGRKIEALEPAQQAVNIRRTLAEQMPEVYLPDLAGSLNNLANRLADLGQKREALEPAQQAVDIRRTLAEQMPEAFLPDLAMSLNNL
ncbi:MAG: tetratricopeptide repeat protein, partial [Desulfovibrio sp.]